MDNGFYVGGVEVEDVTQVVQGGTVTFHEAFGGLADEVV